MKNLIPEPQVSGCGRIIDHRTGKVIHFTINEAQNQEPQPQPQPQPKEEKDADTIDQRS